MPGGDEKWKSTRRQWHYGRNDEGRGKEVILKLQALIKVIWINEEYLRIG